MDKRKLDILAGRPNSGEPHPSGQQGGKKPTLGELSYQRENRDKTPKACASCLFWRKERELCLLHDNDVTVTAPMICNHYVHAEEPSLAPSVAKIFATIEPLDSAYSGLITPAGESSCRTCKYYQSKSARNGACTGARDVYQGAQVEQSGAPLVDALGRCGRWGAKGG